MIRPKRLLFLAHRWFGVVMCLLFALWFASGFIMMYVEYPELTEAERLANLPVLDAERVSLRVEEAVARAAIGAPRSVSLSMVAARPAFRIENVAGDVRIVFADTGETHPGTTAATALAAVTTSSFVPPGAAPRYDAAVEMDQWTVSEALDPHRPLHRVVVGNPERTVLYVSDSTGQVVRDTTRRERFWNWLGSTIHWIYPMQLRRHRGIWVELIVYLSLAGIVSVVTGAVIGFMRLRLGRYRNGSVSPYRGIAKWHHVLGLVGLVFVSTFIFSGLMSVGPWGIFESQSSAAEQIERYGGGPRLDLGAFPALEPAALADDGVKEVEWLQIGGEGHLVLSRSATDRRISVGDVTDAARPAALERRIAHALAAFLPAAGVAGIDRLDVYDDYYYSRHNRYRPLPVLRVRFDDAESTWFHIDLSTGRVISRHTDASRLERWLYNGLHSLDFAILLRHGIVWDATMIALGILGLVFSLTSVVLGWRRLR